MRIAKVVDKRHEESFVVDGFRVEWNAYVGVDRGHGPVDRSGGSVTDGRALELALDTGYAVVEVVVDVYVA